MCQIVTLENSCLRLVLFSIYTEVKRMSFKPPVSTTFITTELVNKIEAFWQVTLFI